MAIKTISNAGGNFNTTGAWTDGILPIAGDSIIATATSGPLTINAATVSIVSADFTNYTSTLTIDNIFNITTTVVFVSSMTISGTTGTLTITPTSGASLTSGGKTLTCGLTTLGTSQTYTLVDNWTVDGTVTLQGTTTQIINGNSLFCNSNLTVTTNATVSGTTTIVFNGTGIWNHTTSGYIQNNITINTTTTLTTGPTIYYSTGTLTYINGTVDTTTNNTVLDINASTTLTTNGIVWANLTINATSTITLGSNFTFNGIFSSNAGTISFTTSSLISSGGSISLSGTAAVTLPNAMTFSTGTFSGVITIIKGDITFTGLLTWGSSATSVNNDGTTRTLICNGGFYASFTTGSSGGSANIRVTGGTIRGSATAYNAGFINVPLFEIAGDVTFSPLGAFYFYGGGAGIPNYFTWTSGTVTTTGSSVWINGGNITLPGISWNNITFLAAGSTTIIYSDIQVNGLLTMGYLTFTSAINNDGTTRTIIANGGLTLSGTTAIMTGTANIRLTGGIVTGVSTVTVRNNLEIAGDVTFASGVTFTYNTGTLSYTSGNVITAGSTLGISASTTLNLGTMPTPLNNLQISSASPTITLLSNLYVITLTLSSTGIAVWTGYTLYIGGSLIHVQNSIQTGTTTFVMNGTGTYSSTSINCIIRNNFTINTTGKITFGAIIAYNTGTFTYLSGNVVVPKNAIMYIAASTTLINCHKINFETVQLNAGQTFTMNEFFSGSPNKPVKVISSSTSNYNITFQNGYEKIAKFVKITNLTLTNTAASKGSLLILNNKGKYFRGSNNIGNIRYTNTTPNGIAKGNPSVPNQMTAPIGGYLSDPVFN
jgi:fibronectin-binding autotransporter adhesin